MVVWFVNSHGLSADGYRDEQLNKLRKTTTDGVISRMGPHTVNRT